MYVGLIRSLLQGFSNYFCVFMRRVLQYVLPRGFKRVRSYGFYSLGGETPLSSDLRHVRPLATRLASTAEDRRPRVRVLWNRHGAGGPPRAGALR